MLEAAMFVVNLLVPALVVWALIACVFRPAAAFPAIERQTKVAWLTFLGIATVVVFFFVDAFLIGVLIIFVTVAFLEEDVGTMLVLDFPFMIDIN